MVGTLSPSLRDDGRYTSSAMRTPSRIGTYWDIRRNPGSDGGGGVIHHAKSDTRRYSHPPALREPPPVESPLMQRARSERARNLPPLLVTAFAMLALLAVLPSALNIPQSNPGETLEYAPVPPEDDQPPPAISGN